MQTVDWSIEFAGIRVSCAIAESDACARLGLSIASKDDLALIRDYFDPHARESILRAGAAYGEHWMFTLVNARETVSRFDDPTKWGTSSF